MARIIVLLCPWAFGDRGLFGPPCHVTSAGLDIVPVVGHVAAKPTPASG